MTSRSARLRTGTDRPGRAVSHPHDAAEQQAHRAAEVVARGGRVTGWAFGSVPVEAAVHREEKGVDEKLKKAAPKVGEALLKTDAGKKVQAAIQDTPLVKKAGEFLDTTAGKAVAGGAVVAGAAGLAAAKKPQPIQAPAIPLDKYVPGLSAKVTVEGPLNAPTYVGLSLTYKEQGKGGKAGPSDKDKIAADTARLRAEAEMFKPQAQKDQEKADEQAAIASWLASQQKRFGTATLLPLKPGDQPKTIDAPATKDPEPTEKKDEPPIQRDPSAAHQADTAVDTCGVDGAVHGTARDLEPGLRRSMEAGFGYDFSTVRIHDDASAAAAAEGVRANAFTVGEDIVFDRGRYDPATADGRRLVAHELAHVVQQRRGPGGDHR